jgi:hypothetical protein
MLKHTILALLILVQSSCATYTTSSTQEVVQQRACFGFKVGYDWIHANMQKIVQQYVDAYNGRWSEADKTTFFSNSWREVQFKHEMKYRINNKMKSSVWPWKRNTEVDGVFKAGKNKLEVSVPFEITTREGPVEISMSSAFVMILEEYELPVDFT